MPNSLEGYFPRASKTNAIANKYYVHEIPNNPNETKRTNISYRLYEYLPGEKISIKGYNTGFQLDQYQELQYDKGAVYLTKEYLLNFGDSAESTIGESTYLDLKNPLNSEVSLERIYNGISYKIRRTILSISDTSFESMPAKVLTGEITTSIPSQDSVINIIPIKFMYCSPYGMVWSEMKRPNSSTVTELISQVEKSDFDRLSAHHRHRIGYIDPSSTLDDTAFELCDKETRIADYYNSIPRAGYYPDKREFQKTIMADLDSSFFKGASGYLTFRFVVNCQGKAGRFTTEMASLDFENQEFSQPLVNHLFSVLHEHAEWTVLNISGEARDSYVYICFKFENGELIDILP